MAVLERNVAELARARDALILKGMIYSPGQSDTAFAVPLLDQFMRRAALELAA